MENLKITQELIDRYVAKTEEFWEEFHSSLSAPFCHYNKYKDYSMKEWINVCRNPEMSPNINFLFQFPILKGEFLIVYASGMFLTNYRIIINDSGAGVPTIPLNKLIEYSSDGLIKFEKNGQLLKLQYSNFLNDNIVNAAMARNDIQYLSKEQLTILVSSFYELKKNNSELVIPKVEIPPQQDISINLKEKIENLNQEQIDKYTVNTEIFWKQFHTSLNNTYSVWNTLKETTFNEWIKICWNSPDLISHFKILFQYPILKGEFPIACAKGFILTNYRLVVNDTSNNILSIPLKKIKKYGLQAGGIIEIENQIEKLRYSEMIKDEIINAAISRVKQINLDKIQEQIITYSIIDLEQEYSDLQVSKIEMYPLSEEQKIEKVRIEKLAKNEIKRSKVIFGIIIIAVIIGAIFIFGRSGNSGKSFTCEECGKNFTHQPYQGIMNMCIQAAPGKESAGLEYFCSCNCCTEHRAKEGFNYECK